MESSLNGGTAHKHYGVPRTASRFHTSDSGQNTERPLGDGWGGRLMQRIVVAVKAGEQQPWLADAAAQLAKQTGATVEVVSVDGLELEALSTVPRSELAALAQDAVDGAVARLRENGVEATGEVRPGQVTRGILLFAEEHEADVIMCGASTRGPVATRVMGSVPIELVQRSRRPVLMITPPHAGEAS
jgi:nucleotide-binding universal stress UspA family protein